MQEELNNFTQNEVWSLVQRPKQNVIGTKWVFRNESAFIPFVSFGDLDNNTFKGLTSLLSVEQEIQDDEPT